jgi:spore maturation protein CgeB
VADSPEDVVDEVRRLSPEEARTIGAAARDRVLAEHTPERRAAELETHLHELLVAAA